jgi:hypothetical protein
MAVTAADIHWFKAASGDSEGGGLGAVEITGTAKNNFWPQISDSERVAGGTKTRKWFVENQNATDSLLVPSFYIFQTPTNTTEQLGIGFNDSDDDDPTQGNMTAWGASAVLAAVSDGSDTRTVTIYGLNGSGTPVRETITLTGTSEVVSVATFSVVYGVHMSALSGSRTVTIKQGSGGTTRGTIGTGQVMCFLWLTPSSKATGIRLPDLASGQEYGFWDRLTWSAGVGSVRPTQSVVAVEENT